MQEREGKVVEPLTLESVAHIKYPARKQRQRVQTLAMLAGKGKGKKAKGAAAMLAGTGLDEGDYIMEVREGRAVAEACRQADS